MHPVLFHLGPLEIHTYGVMVLLGFVAGMVWLIWSGKRAGMDPAVLFDLAFAILLSAFGGAKLLYLLLHWQEYLANPVLVLTEFRAGFVFLGGLIAAATTTIWFVKKHRLPLGITADCAAPAIALGHGIGRIGCLMAGCCYGTICHLPWAVTFTDPASTGLTGVPLYTPLHPTQLYESLAEFTVFAFLVLLSRRAHAKGVIFCVYLMLYSVLRFGIEFLRGDPRGFPGGGTLATSQFIAIPTFLVGLGGAVYLQRKRAKTGIC